MARKSMTTEDFIVRSKVIYGDNKYDYSLTEYINSNNKVKIIYNGVVYEQTPSDHYRANCEFSKNIGYDEFIRRCKKKHGDKYDYSLSEYVNVNSKIKIIYDGIVYIQKARSHMDGFCPEINTGGGDAFLRKCIKMYGNKYDLSKVIYVNNNTKVIIGCSEHGDFEILPRSFLSGFCCAKCGRNTLTHNDFITKAREIHGDKYDYSKSRFEYNKDKIIIGCREGHGDFELSVSNHIHIGTGCSKCSGNRKLTTDEFIAKSRERFVEYNYSYEKTVYGGYDKPVTITCPKHGDFTTISSLHLGSNSKCNKCKSTNTWTYEYFLEQAKLVHGEIYIYNQDGFVNSSVKIDIQCRKHGLFSQSPDAHIRNGAGCPICKTSKGERKIKNKLDEYSINYSYQHKFSDCKNILPLPFDFYLPEHNICIEFDGKQHFEPISIWGGVDGFNSIIMRDGIKTKYCNDNNIKLLRICYKENIEEMLDFLISPVKK